MKQGTVPWFKTESGNRPWLNARFENEAWNETGDGSLVQIPILEIAPGLLPI